MIYLDNAATTKVCDMAADAVLNTMTKNFGNPSSLYRLGLDAQNIITDSAKTIATFIGCDSKEILFTSGATESNNIALLGAVSANKRSGNKIIISSLEHPSVWETAMSIKNDGFDVVEISPREDGILYTEDFIDAVDDKTILVSCMLVNNETGAMFPIDEIARGVHKKSPKTLVHVDAVQGFGKVLINLKRLQVDLLSISGHKIYAPKGIGALFIRKGTKIKPLFYGGGQQLNMRVGTEPVPLIAGLAAACEYSKKNMQLNLEHFKLLKEHFLNIIKDVSDITIHESQNAVPYIINFSVNRVKSEVLLHFLEQEQIYVSSGSACSKGKKSRVLKSFGYADKELDTSIRISFSADNTTDELDILVERLKLGIKTLAKLR